jgi:asparagine synthase (glutamine-hydrolysing)
MFAFGFVDLAGRSLLLARDYYGIKPLFVVRKDRYVAFASDLRVLLGLPGVSRRVDEARALEVLRFGGAPLPARQSIFKDIECLLPGESLTVDLDGVERADWERWYRPSGLATYDKPFATAAREVRDAFLESVGLHLKADVRVGCALSGGLDSSAIVMAMRHLLGAKGEVHTVSHVARSSAKNEERWIDVANAAAGAVAHKVAPDPQDLTSDIDDLIPGQGEPFGTTSIYAQYRVFREAKRQGLTVMLDGQGADELLAGYAGYMTNYLWELLRQNRWADAVHLLTSKDARAKSSVPSQLLRLVSAYAPAPILDAVGRLLGRGSFPRWLRTGEISQQTKELEPGYRKRWRVGLKSSLSDSVLNILANLLRYEDRNSMRFSIESRVPFLSNRFADLVLSMPPHYIIGPAGQTKYVFREAMRGLVPEAILERRDKIGFENDERAWLRGAAAWVNGLLEASKGRSRFVDTNRLRAEWNRFLGHDRSPVAHLWSTFLYLRWLGLHDAED